MIISRLYSNSSNSQSFYQNATKFCCALGFLTLASVSSASIFTYTGNTPSGNHNAGILTEINTSYNTQTHDFAWNHTISDLNATSVSDGFWLVISDGPNPKTHAGQYSILYGDAANSRVTAYEYSGQNNANSWQTPGNFLGSWQLSVNRNVSDDASTFAFNLDPTAMNGSYSGFCTESSGNCDNNGVTWNESMWQGLEFGDRLGYWFHPFIGSQFSYDANGAISSFQYSQQGWYDYSNLTTSAVSEPATLSILIIALSLGAAFRRRA